METENLRLIQHSPADLLALIESEESYFRQTGRPPAAGLRDFLVSGEVSPDFVAMLRSSTATDPWKHGFALMLKPDGPVVGLAGFKAPPTGDRVVEIGYGVVASHQGRGYATEAARALTDFAFVSGRVDVVRAHTRPEPNASTRVLAKAGFRQAGSFDDPDDGPVWRWETLRGSDS